MLEKQNNALRNCEPIFGSADIMHQMPKAKANDSKLLTKLSEMSWKRLIRDHCPHIVMTNIHRHSLLKAIQRGLNDYLETKRLALPRFFFLSNDELLEIFAETKDPLRVQPHLKKLF